MCTYFDFSDSFSVIPKKKMCDTNNDVEQTD